MTAPRIRDLLWKRLALTDEEAALLRKLRTSAAEVASDVRRAPVKCVRALVINLLTETEISK